MHKCWQKDSHGYCSPSDPPLPLDTHLLGLPDCCREFSPVRLGRLGQLHPVLDPQPLGLGHQAGSSQALCLGASQLRMLVADTELEKGGG